MQPPRAKWPDRLQFKAWKRGRAVEGTGLENRRRGNPFVSSNLTASAKFTIYSSAAFFCESRYTWASCQFLRKSRFEEFVLYAQFNSAYSRKAVSFNPAAVLAKNVQ